MQIEYLKKCTYASSSPSFLATIRDFKCAASICPSSIVNSANASSTSVSVNLSPQVMSECLNISASILPLISNASKDLRMVSSSSVPPAIFSAKSVTICVKLTGPGDSESMLLASPEEMDLPTAANALTKSSADKRPFLSQSMIPKASLNSWICLCENMAKMFEPLFLAFLDPAPFAILKFVFYSCCLRRKKKQETMSCQVGTRAVEGLLNAGNSKCYSF